MNIVIVGTGNTATVLGRKFKGAGHHILQVIGRNKDATENLAIQLGAECTTNLRTVHQEADVIVLAVADDAIAAVANSLPATEKVVMHTAASVSKGVLQKTTNRYGVFYPLQSLRKELSRLPLFPMLIDAGDDETLGLLKDLAYSITNQVLVANDEQRVKIHLAAVMANNFTNHFFTLVENYCRKEGLNFSLLLPLIKETVNRLEEISPSLAQTGPAVRSDTATIAKHLTLLEKAPGLQLFYELFTKSIQESRT